MQKITLGGCGQNKWHDIFISAAPKLSKQSSLQCVIHSASAREVPLSDSNVPPTPDRVHTGSGDHVTRLARLLVDFGEHLLCQVDLVAVLEAAQSGGE
jgi:hypothetical protein